MSEGKDKRDKIFSNYKESVKRAKFAPLTKYALDIGNPSTAKDDERSKVNKDTDSILLNYKISQLEKKINRLYVITFISLAVSFIALYVGFNM